MRNQNLDHLEKKILDVAVISDVHLGTYGCHARQLLKYLKSIQPRLLILNGDIIDGWQFSKRYFPAAHFAVIREIINMAEKGVKVVYISGNHDEFLRKYRLPEIGNVQFADKFIFELDQQKVWVFHGDVFDNTTRGSARLLAKLGGKGYDLLILLNRLINAILFRFTGRKISLAHKIKNGVKAAVKYINNFEKTIAELAIAEGYDYVICGHIHQPKQQVFTHQNKRTVYLNSGDWVEHLTALEYSKGTWTIYTYPKETYQEDIKFKRDSLDDYQHPREVEVFFKKMVSGG